MLTNQKNKFSLEDGITWLNGSYMSPQLKSVEEVGIAALKRKSKPWTILPADFFNEVEEVKKLFASLIHATDVNRIALIPSVSYGIANVARNIKFDSGDEIILVDQLFPSNYFIWKKIANEKKLNLKIVKAPETLIHRGQKWNEEILNSINSKTKVISLEHCHWADGTRFELKKIREATKKVGALMIIDGTQSIGAYPFDQNEYNADALIAAGYKWMLGPYSIGMAYYNTYFDHGDPIEHNWINKMNSEVFEKLTDYEENFKPGAARYSMGEQSQFIHAPMLKAAITQLIEWGQENIQNYLSQLLQSALPTLRDKKIWIEESTYRGNHLFGLRPNYKIDAKLKQKLIESNVFVSYRSEVIRVSPNVYNTEEDLARLISLL
jgi:selenocysteine lyase/cysteine desulfurase